MELFKAPAEENRLRILGLLADGELCVCEIEHCLSLSQSNISRHLAALKVGGIVESEKKAQWTYYRISALFIETHSALWGYIKGGLSALPTYKADSQKRQTCRVQDLCGCGKKPH